MSDLRFHALGEAALCCVLPPPLSADLQARLLQLSRRLARDSQVLSLTPGMNNLTVEFDPLATAPAALQARIDALWNRPAPRRAAGRRIDIPVRYGGTDGPDLARVAEHCGMTPDEVVRRHTACDYVVYFLGFQPGFAYLGGLDERLHTPRRDEPRLTVPPGSVGIGGAQTGIYPLATPGGWQLIGRTSLSLFDPLADPPTRLAPGDRVRFVAEHA